MKIDLYDLLGISREATQEEIKKAYRDMSKEHHPDKGGDREEFETIQKAYETLSDPEKREYYDMYGTDKESFDLVIAAAVTLFKRVMELEPDNIGVFVKDSVDQVCRDLNNQISGFNRQIEKIDLIISRIKTAPKNDFLRAVLNNDKKAMQHNIEILEDRKDITEQAAELLGEYVFEVSDEPVNTGSMRYALNQAMSNYKFYDDRTF